MPALHVRTPHSVSAPGQSAGDAQPPAPPVPLLELELVAISPPEPPEAPEPPEPPVPLLLVVAVVPDGELSVPPPSQAAPKIQSPAITRVPLQAILDCILKLLQAVQRT